jgi:hypothetical protein
VELSAWIRGCAEPSSESRFFRLTSERAVQRIVGVGPLSLDHLCRLPTRLGYRLADAEGAGVT